MSKSSHSTSSNDYENDPIKKFKELYNTADQFSREVSEFRSEVAIPAYNELRYAGYHLKKAIDDEGVVSDVEEIRKAISHCERALYEASEAGIIKTLSIINIFKDDYKNLVVGEIVKDYSDILKQAQDGKALLSQGRGDDRTHPERSLLYMATFEKLKGSCDKLEYNRDDLNAKALSIKRENIRWIVGIILALITLVSMTFIRLFPNSPP